MSHSKQINRSLSGTCARLARIVLIGWVMFSCTACLVVESPDFRGAERGAPRLTSVLPMTELIKVLPASNALPSFTATVISEDAGSDLLTSLLIDYGVEAANGAPWQSTEVGPTLEAKSVSDGPRDIQITWTPQVGKGCHTVTMLVTHQRKDGGNDFLCPVSADDFDTLTWVVSLCEEVNGDVVCSFDDCAVKSEQSYKYCDAVGPLSNQGEGN